MYFVTAIFAIPYDRRYLLLDLFKDFDNENVMTWSFHFEKNAKDHLDYLENLKKYVLDLDQKLSEYLANFGVSRDSKDTIKSFVEDQIDSDENFHSSFDEKLFWIFFEKLSRDMESFELKIICDKISEI